VLEWLLIHRLYRRDHLYQVLLTYGLILMLEEMRSLLWGDDVHSVPDPFGGSFRLTETLSYPVYRLWISAVCLAVAASMYVVIRRTRLGMMIRAGASNSEMAQALGINLGLLNRLVFALGIGGAALAGMIASPVSSVFPGMGSQVLIISFVVVVIGGIGSLKGAMVAALLIGLVDTFGKVSELEIAGLRILPALSGTAIYLLMAGVLVWRPEGIFGRKP
jgi:branched-chain amino acid transport system permease protein